MSIKNTSKDVKRLRGKELMLSNCGAREDSWESLGLQRDQTILQEINPEYSLEGLMLKLQYFRHQTGTAHWLEKIFESPLDSKKIKLVSPSNEYSGNQPWIFIGRTDAEAEASILWPSDAKSHLIAKDPDWRQKEKRAAENEKVWQHHWLNRHESEQTAGDSGRQRSLVWCSPWGHRVKHDLATEQQQRWLW